jgi:glycerophosphoryl diester phosphodiesterase
MTRIIAHRGSSTIYPENSMAAFSHAKVSGADALEVDVRRSSDGKLFCFHDRRLTRLTGHKSEFEETHSSVIEQLRIKSQEPLLSLPSFLSSFAGRIGVVLDIKSVGIGEELLAHTGDWPEHYPLVYSSFYADVLQEIKNQHGRAKTALIVGPLRNLRPSLDLTDHLLRQVEKLGCEAIHLSKHIAGAQRIQRLIREQLQVCVWTVDKIAEADKFSDWGAHGIITNVPEVLVRDFAARGRLE